MKLLPLGVVLLLRTELTFGCPDHRVVHTFEQRADTLVVRLLGVDAPRGPTCHPVAGPATLRRDLPRVPGRYVLLVQAAGQEDRFVVTVTDSSLALLAAPDGPPGFVTADERLRWRHPAQSFVLRCSEVAVARGLCGELERWLLRQPGITGVSLGAQGINPFAPEGEDWVTSAPADLVLPVFRYADEGALQRVRACLASIDEQIRPTVVGIELSIETLRGGPTRARSTRLEFEPHVPVPSQVTGTTACGVR